MRYRVTRGPLYVMRTIPTSQGSSTLALAPGGSSGLRSPRAPRHAHRTRAGAGSADTASPHLGRSRWSFAGHSACAGIRIMWWTNVWALGKLMENEIYHRVWFLNLHNPCDLLSGWFGFCSQWDIHYLGESIQSMFYLCGVLKQIQVITS